MGGLHMSCLWGKRCKAVVVPIGEKVSYRKLRAGVGKKNKAEIEWFEEIWVCPATASS